MKYCVLAFLLAAALAGCGNLQTESNFQPPQGWSATPTLFGRVQVWTKKDAAGTQSLMLIKGDAGQGDIFYNPQLALNTMHNVTHDTVKVCDNRTAQHYRGVKANGAIVEGIEVPGPGRVRYAALYVRGNPKTPVNTDAERALHSLCPNAT